jgi:copper homeostasis protein
MILEVCIDSAFAAQAAKAAYEGGASRIELCSQMKHDGLTPSLNEIKEARQVFPKPGLMVMIRPRTGNFVYNSSELEQMQQQIQHAKNAGADGIVFGALQEKNLDYSSTRDLTQLAKSLNLSVTFHRAFDAVENRAEALEELIKLGVDHVLTSGTAWGSKQGALEGLPVIQVLLEQADNRIEIIVGGGINISNIKEIIKRLEGYKNFSIHAYSGAQENGATTVQAVKMLRDFIKKAEG